MSHIHERIDFTVCVYIIFEDKVLLIHHKGLDRWLPIGGHIELDEDPDEALLREVKEECGLDIAVIGQKPDVISPGTKILYTPHFMDLHNISETHKHVGLIYVARAFSDQVKLNQEEHRDIRWFSAEDLTNLKFELAPAIIFYAQQALAMV